MTAEKRTELAQDRTEKAEDRTLLANERTFAGWCRTAFASIGLGLAFKAIFNKVEPTWIAKAIASMFILLGIWIIWKAYKRSSGLHRRLTEHDVEIADRDSFRTLAIAVSIGATLLTIAMWIFY